MQGTNANNNQRNARSRRDTQCKQQNKGHMNKKSNENVKFKNPFTPVVKITDVITSH